MKAYGPVPSRRLGRSLGVNNIPPKVCTYSCMYCQLGNTLNVQTERSEFLSPHNLKREVESKVKKISDRSERVDFISLVPDGEPTLDRELGHTIELLRSFGFPIAVISNASLLWQEDVRSDLKKADWVSVKVDAVTESLWKKINRPHGYLSLEKILTGISAFSRNFEGTLASETMLLRNYNDGEEELEKIAEYLGSLELDVAYLAIPTRPPAEDWAEPTTEERIAEAYDLFTHRLERVEHLIGYEGNDFTFTGNLEEDLLSITSVHPMRREAVEQFLQRADGEWSVVEGLLQEGELISVEYGDVNYYLRKLPTS